MYGNEECHLSKTPISRLPFGEGKPKWFELQFLTKEGVFYHISKSYVRTKGREELQNGGTTDRTGVLGCIS